jgi:hypothetical protein
MCLNKDMSVDCIFAMWDEPEGHLYIYGEYSSAMPSVSMIVSSVSAKMRLSTHVVDDFFGNDFMFDDRMRTFAREINDAFLKSVKMQDVKVRMPRRYDVYGSVSVLNDLIQNKRISIHDSCTGIRSSLMNWKIDNGRVLEEGKREGILILVSELSRIIPVKEIIKAIPYKRSISGKVKAENALVRVMKEVEDATDL